jgi:hypothetical protein
MSQPCVSCVMSMRAIWLKLSSRAFIHRLQFVYVSSITRAASGQTQDEEGQR